MDHIPLWSCFIVSLVYHPGKSHLNLTHSVLEWERDNVRLYGPVVFGVQPSVCVWLQSSSRWSYRQFSQDVSPFDLAAVLQNPTKAKHLLDDHQPRQWTTDCHPLTHTPNRLVCFREKCVRETERDVAITTDVLFEENKDPLLTAGGRQR